MSQWDSVFEELDGISREMQELADPGLDEIEALLARRETLLREITAADPQSLGRESVTSLRGALGAGELAHQKLVRARQRVFFEWQTMRQMRAALNSRDASHSTISVKL
ncbi:MAG TPA: hypothetical protein VKU01_01310 [Bryobacteraceae bacterium]|nr:hypothetical protein [Bryobacteraceae bacterium]